MRKDRLLTSYPQKNPLGFAGGVSLHCFVPRQFASIGRRLISVLCLTAAMVFLAGLLLLPAAAQTTYTVTRFDDTNSVDLTSTDFNYGLPGLGVGVQGDLRYGLQQ